VNGPRGGHGWRRELSSIANEPGRAIQLEVRAAFGRNWEPLRRPRGNIAKFKEPEFEGPGPFAAAPTSLAASTSSRRHEVRAGLEWWFQAVRAQRETRSVRDCANTPNAWRRTNGLGGDRIRTAFELPRRH
jgi:hypothetical protein